MPSADRRAEATWQGDLLSGGGQVALVSSEAGEFPVTWAARVETPDGRTSPEELVAAAHASCYAMAFSNYLAKNGTSAERLDVTAVVSLGDREGGGIEVTQSALEVRGRVPALDGEGFQAAAQEAEKGCPISNALRGSVPITVTATLEG
jgi:osmotically inducible protein OsmC